MNEQRNLYMAIGISIAIIVFFQILLPTQPIQTPPLEQDEAFDPATSIDGQNNNIEKEIKIIKDQYSSIGAVNTFVGYVRDINNNRDVKFLDVEVYKEMAIKELSKIKDSAVNACSPPDNKVIDCKRFPGGLTNISKPASRGSSESTSSNFALPPLNNFV